MILDYSNHTVSGTYRHFVSETFDPLTGQTTATYQDTQIKAILSSIRDELIGEKFQYSDRLCICDYLGDVTLNKDLVILEGKTYEVIEARRYLEHSELVLREVK
jgi:hypothetical protein